MRKEQQRILLAIEAGRVKRCHCFPTNSDSTVGLHTFNAMSMLLILCPDPTINMIKALQFHDMAERFLGDIPAPAKIRNKFFGKQYEIIERDILTQYGMNPELNEREAIWVHAMDLLEFFIFTKHELHLGNKYAQQRCDRICSYINRTKLPLPVLEFWVNIQSEGILSELDDGDF